MFENELDSIKKSFANYLSSLGISPKSHKNYRSDLNHFGEWVILKIRSFGSYPETLSDAIPFLSTKLVTEYKSFLSENKTPVKTINRRLSTLRHLARFLQSEELIDNNFMDGVENVNLTGSRFVSFQPLIGDYKAFLEAKKASKSTIKNYTSDVRQFLSWLEANQQIVNSKS